MRKSSARSAWLPILTVALLVAIVAGIGVAYTRWQRGVDDAIAEARSGPQRELPEEKRDPVALWIGDSYTAGTGSDLTTTSYARQVCSAMGWVCNVDAAGGTGFVAAIDEDFAPLPARLDKTYDRFFADVIIVDAGRNDGKIPDGPVRESAEAYFDRLRDYWPKAELIAILPWYLDKEQYSDRIKVIIRDVAEKHGAKIVDPYSEGWTISSKTEAMLMPDNAHFFQPGHDLVTRRLVSAFRKLGLSTIALTEPRLIGGSSSNH
mgnify:CR=1 FL=1